MPAAELRCRSCRTLLGERRGDDLYVLAGLAMRVDQRPGRQRVTIVVCPCCRTPWEHRGGRVFVNWRPDVAAVG